METGWERNRRTHFDEIVLNYDRVRPEYPRALFEDITAYSGPGRGKKALEIGAGTGKATAPILAAVYDVTAVEIGANMAEFLRDKFRAHEGFRVIVSAFEDAILEEGGYDLVYAASAFHWVDAEIGCPKAFRLLKNGGTFALMRYNTFRFVDEALNEEIQAVYDKYYLGYYKQKKRLPDRSREDFRKPSEILGGYGFEDMGRYGFRDVALNLYDVTRTFGADEYILFLDTLADHRNLPEGDRAALYAGVREAILRHGGQYGMDDVFQLYMGRK